MTATPGWKIVGFIGASATEPAFVLPVLRRDGGNSLVLQRIDEHGRISEFEPLDDDDAADTVTHVHSPFQRHIGDPPLWAFRLTPDDHLVAEKPELRAYLAERLDAPELRAAPLVRLRVIQFIDRDDLLIDALRDAYALMQTLPADTARFWRDNVVLAQRCRDVLREKGIPEDTIDTEVRTGTLWIHPLDEIADSVDWTQALKLYVDAFGLGLMVGATEAKTEPPLALITAYLTRSWRVVTTLHRRKALPMGVTTSASPPEDQFRVKDLQRVYIFVDGSEGLPVRFLHNLRPAVAPCPIHLIWADFGLKLPTEEHEKAADAITLLPARTQWPGEGTLNSPEALSTTDLLELFLHMAAANKFEHEPRGAFVAARPEAMRISIRQSGTSSVVRSSAFSYAAPDREVASQLWISAINTALPPWEANHLAFSGRPHDTPSITPTFGFLRSTLHRSGNLMPFRFNGVVSHLYEGWKAETAPDLATQGYAQAFQMMGWEASWFRGDTWFEVSSAPTGRVHVTLTSDAIGGRNVAGKIKDFLAIGAGNHIIIPIGPRPGPDALGKMIVAGLNVILPHRLPLMALPQSEWAYRYPPLSQLNGGRLRAALRHHLRHQIDEAIAAAGHQTLLRSRQWEIWAKKENAGALILAEIKLWNDDIRGHLQFSLSPSGVELTDAAFFEE